MRHCSKAHTYMPYLLNHDDKQLLHEHKQTPRLSLLLPMTLNHSCDANQHVNVFSVIICPV